MEYSDTQTEMGLAFSAELSALTTKYREKEIDGRELISVLLHIAKLHACLGFTDFNYMTGCLSNCLHENLAEMYEECKK